MKSSENEEMNQIVIFILSTKKIPFSMKFYFHFYKNKKILFSTLKFKKLNKFMYGVKPCII